MAIQYINRRDYPELDTILWDIQAETVTAEFAFQMYERRWCYIEPNLLTDDEKLLIESLIKNIGHGHFLPS